MSKISAYTAAGTLTGTEEVPVVQGGSTVHTTTAAIAALASGGGGGGGGGGSASVTSLKSLIMAQSPYAYYRFVETSGTQMTDSSGNARHGTYYGTVGLGAPSLGPDADDYSLCLYTVPSSGGWSGGVLPWNPDGWSAFSVEFLFIVTSGQTASGETATSGRIISDGQLGTYGNIEVVACPGSDPSQMLFNYSASNGYATVGTGCLVKAGAPNHMALTFDGTTWIAYINGMNIYSRAPGGTGTLSGGTANMFVGNQAGGGAPTAPNGQQNNSSQFLGYIDELAFYQSALSASDVLARVKTLRVTTG